MSLKRDIKKYSQFCAYCGFYFTAPEQKSIDHLIPKSDKKKYKVKLGNLVCACHSCNQQKADNSLKEWLKSKFRRNRLNIYIDYMRNFKKNYSELIYKKVREAV